MKKILLLLLLLAPLWVTAQDRFQKKLMESVDPALAQSLKAFLQLPDQQPDNLLLIPVTTYAMEASYYLRDGQGIPLLDICAKEKLPFTARALPALTVLVHNNTVSQLDQKTMAQAVPATTGSLLAYPTTLRGLRNWATDKAENLRPCVAKALQEYRQALDELEKKAPHIQEQFKEINENEQLLKRGLYEYDKHATTEEAMRLLFDEKRKKLEAEAAESAQLIERYKQFIKSFEEVLQRADNYQEEVDQINHDKEITDRLLKNSPKHYGMLLQNQAKAQTIRDVYGSASNMNSFLGLPIQLQEQVEQGNITLKEAIEMN